MSGGERRLHGQAQADILAAFETTLEVRDFFFRSAFPLAEKIKRGAQISKAFEVITTLSVLLVALLPLHIIIRQCQLVKCFLCTRHLRLSTMWHPRECIEAVGDMR